jgi:hypothetical protein
MPDRATHHHKGAAIARLARDTHTAIAKVQEIFLAEYEKLAPSARIKAFLPLLTGKRVRALLRKATDR